MGVQEEAEETCEACARSTGLLLFVQSQQGCALIGRYREYHGHQLEQELVHICGQVPLVVQWGGAGPRQQEAGTGWGLSRGRVTRMGGEGIWGGSSFR
jgi:hypothetical protein